MYIAVDGAIANESLPSSEELAKDLGVAAVALTMPFVVGMNLFLKFTLVRLRS
jgi:hypothetical protein